MYGYEPYKCLCLVGAGVVEVAENDERRGVGLARECSGGQRTPVMQEGRPSALASASPLESRAYTLEVTGKGIAEIEDARSRILPGTPINIAFLGNESHDQRINAARVIRTCGFEPVPILSARRLRSMEDLDRLLHALIEEAAPSRFILVGGDPAQPAGPFADSLGLLSAGILRRHAIRRVGIVAYPEGHHMIDADALWRSLKWKVAFLREEGCAVEITTQFGFDVDAVSRWIVRLRDEGIDCPVRVGVPGPAGAGRLLGFARQFGVVSSARIVRRYGIALADPVQHVGPERFLDRLAAGLVGRDPGSVLFHLYPFGGIAEATIWMDEYLAKHGVPGVASLRSARPGCGNPR